MFMKLDNTWALLGMIAVAAGLSGFGFCLTRAQRCSAHRAAAVRSVVDPDTPLILPPLDVGVGSESDDAEQLWVEANGLAQAPADGHG